MKKMRRRPVTSLATLALLAAAALIPATALLSSSALAQSDKDGSAPTEEAAKADADGGEVIEAPAEPERISGKIYKIDSEAKIVGILVQMKPSRAYKRYKLSMGEKSLILVGGQPSDLTALAEGQSVDVGYWKRGKLEVIDTIAVN